MSGIFDTNNLSSSAKTGYFIRRTEDAVTIVGGLMVYWLSASMLISALQARMILFIRSASGSQEARMNQIIRDLGAPYTLRQLAQETQVDGNWAGRTQTMLLIVCTLLGFPESYLAAIVQGYRLSQVNWESAKAAICIAYVMASPIAAPAPGAELDRSRANLAKLLGTIELRYSNVASGAGVTTTQVMLPQWRRANGVSRDAPRAQTINQALGITFTSTRSPQTSAPPTPPAARENTQVVAPPPQPEERPSAPPSTPPPSTPPRQPEERPSAPPSATPPVRQPTQTPVRPTVTTASASGALIGLGVLGAIAAIAAVSSTTGKKKSSFFG